MLYLCILTMCFQSDLHRTKTGQSLYLFAVLVHGVIMAQNCVVVNYCNSGNFQSLEIFILETKYQNILCLCSFYNTIWKIESEESRINILCTYIHVISFY